MQIYIYPSVELLVINCTFNSEVSEVYIVIASFQKTEKRSPYVQTYYYFFLVFLHLHLSLSMCSR